GQHAVAVIGRRTLDVDGTRQPDMPDAGPAHDLATVIAGLLALAFARLLCAQREHVVRDRNVDVLAPETRDLGSDDDIVGTFGDVDARPLRERRETFRADLKRPRRAHAESLDEAFPQTVD